MNTSPNPPPGEASLALVRRRNVNWYKLGLALAAAREHRLYEPAYPTFEAFVRAEAGMSLRRAYQMIEAARTAEAIASAHPEIFVQSKLNKPGAGKEPPKAAAPETEGQLRPLTKLRPDRRAAVWAKACAAAGGKVPTARAVAEAVRQHLRELASGVDGLEAALRENRDVNDTFGWLGDLRTLLRGLPPEGIAGRYWRRHRRAGLARVRWAAAYFSDLRQQLERHQSQR